MSFKILYVTATSAEADTIKKINDLILFPDGYHLRDIEISQLITGVGSISTAWAIKQWLSMNEKPDLAINGGIAGSFRDEYGTGDVVMPVTDRFADAGIEDGNNFLTLAEAGLAGTNEFPFRNGSLNADKKYFDIMNSLVRPVNAITVNTATGTETTRNKLVQKFNPDIETMEGATFFYICSRENIPFMALRAISNMVGPRDKSKWKILLALDNLSYKLNEIILKLE